MRLRGKRRESLELTGYWIGPGLPMSTGDHWFCTGGGESVAPVSTRLLVRQ